MRTAVVIVLSALVVGCDPGAGPDPNALLDVYGLQSSTNGTSDTDAAIKIVNTVLAKDALHLQGTWPSAVRVTGAVVPVYLVGDRNLTPGDLAFVTPSCEAIVLHNPPFLSWVASLSDADGPSVAPEAMTAFVLLHELGHLRRRDCGREMTSDDQAPLNDQANEDKAQEFAADTVAVTNLRTATQYGNPDSKVAASRVEMALATTSFYISGRRIVASPGADLLGTPSVFWDIGLSHPNFEWRMLKVNDLLNSTEVSRKLLEDFEAGRSKGAQPLYLSPGNR